MTVSYIYLVDDYPRTHEDSDAQLKAYWIKNHDKILAWSTDDRAPTLMKYAKAIILLFDKYSDKMEKVVPKEFKYSNRLDKAVKTGCYRDYHSVAREGGTEIEEHLEKMKAEEPEFYEMLERDQLEIVWEVKYISKIENGDSSPRYKIHLRMTP